MPAPSERMRIGQLARRAAVTIRTIHHYERHGLLGPGERSSGGHRYYGQEALERLNKIRQLKDLGLKLEEIAAVLDGLCGAPSALEGGRLLDALRAQLAEAEARIADLRRLRADLIKRIEMLEQALVQA